VFGKNHLDFLAHIYRILASLSSALKPEDARCLGSTWSCRILSSGGNIFHVGVVWSQASCTARYDFCPCDGSVFHLQVPVMA